MFRLLNPERLVCVKRVLRYPDNEITFETMPYWLALAIVAEVVNEQNVKSLRILELEDVD